MQVIFFRPKRRLSDMPAASDGQGFAAFRKSDSRHGRRQENSLAAGGREKVSSLGVQAPELMLHCTAPAKPQRGESFRPPQ